MGNAGAAVPYLLPPQISPPLFSLRHSSLLFSFPAARLNLAAADLSRSISALPPPPPPILSSRRGVQPKASRSPLSAPPRRRPLPRQEAFEDEEEDDLWEDEEEEEEEEEEGDSSGEPLEEMRRWMKNKPSGFGEGKMYDTSLEDQLFEEIERSRKAQAANLNKLKNEGDGKKNPSQDQLAKKQQQKKVADMNITGICVRIWNLPKKKNIHRDLHLAFKGFPGVVSINPAVIGNEKTRDPICKGFAFLDLSSEEAARRFVQVYSEKNILFGKLEKQIDCAIMNRHQISNSLEPFSALGLKKKISFEKNKVSIANFQLSLAKQTNTLVVDDIHGSEMTVVSKGSSNSSDSSQKPKEQRASKKKDDIHGSEMARVSKMSNNSSNSSQQKEQRASKKNDDFNGSEMVVTSKVLNNSSDSSQKQKEQTTLKKNDDFYGSEITVVSKVSNNISDSLQKHKEQKILKKKAVKRTSVKSSNSNLPGSAARLKIKERIILNGVFSKYGRKQEN